MSERRFYGYYVSFQPTGVEPIDAILEAVAQSCRAYHHIDNWGDEPLNRFDGRTCKEQIQHAANEAAREFEREGGE